MKYDKKKLSILIVAGVIVILIVVYIFYYLNLKKKIQNEPIGLTTEERTAIVKQLSEGMNTKPITKAKRNDIVKELGSNKSTGKVPNLTNNQRQDIVKSL
jgi:flagellar biosynthesis/type III secretory pathway M-ring protein FliF/YscJ